MASDSHRKEFDALFSAMLPPTIAERFSSLLALKPERWAKIDPWRVWDEPTFGQPHVTELRRESPEAFPPLASHLGSMVRVLRCGNSSNPSIIEEPLRGVLDGSSHLLDGFVSVDTGRLGLAINHDGGICALRKPSHLTTRWSGRVKDKVPSPYVGARAAQLNR
jgi:hypothetical protein